MPRSVNADEARALLLADTLRRVPSRLSRVQTALKRIAQGKSAGMSRNERLTVAQACTELQFAIADVESVVSFVAGSLEAAFISEQSIAQLGQSHGAAASKKGTDLH